MGYVVPRPDEIDFAIKESIAAYKKAMILKQYADLVEGDVLKYGVSYVYFYEKPSLLRKFICFFTKENPHIKKLDTRFIRVKEAEKKDFYDIANAMPSFGESNAYPESILKKINSSEGLKQNVTFKDAINNW